MENSVALALLIKESLNNIRLKLGSRCTYLAFEDHGDYKYLCANLKNEIGGVDKVRQRIEGEVQDLTLGDFDSMYNILNEKLYVGN